MQVRVYASCHRFRQHSSMQHGFHPNHPFARASFHYGSFRSSSSPYCQASRVPSPRTTIAMAASAALRRMMAQDPVLTACAVLSAIGLGAPLIVPPIRNAMNRPEPITPPKLANVVEGMTGKARN